jgi:hypothetical protein
MTSVPLELDPNLEEILRDIARDPRSTLFHTTPRQLALGLRNRTPRISSRQAALSSAERHLLEVYREEVAWLLYKACQRGVLENPNCSVGVHRWITRETQVVPLTPGEWTTHADETRRQLQSLSSGPDSLSILGSLDLDARFPRRPLRGIAIASLRLIPRDETRLLYAMASIQANDNGGSLQALQLVTENHPTPLNAYAAYANRALVLWQAKLLRPALDEYQRAGRVEPGSAIASAYALCVSILLENQQQALIAATHLEDLGTTVEPGLAECIEYAGMQRRSSTHKITRQQRRIVQVIVDACPRTAGRIASVYM